MERHDRVSQGLEKQNEPHPAETVNVPTENETPSLVDTPAENTDALVPEAIETLPNEGNAFADMFLPADLVSEEAPAEDMPVSPYGFGPYPKVPLDYPGGDDPKFWEYPRTDKHELMTRVRIKLWEQGKYTHGSSFENGLVYPVFSNTLIVKWKSQLTPFGTRKRASDIHGSPETESFLRSHSGPIYDSDIPSDIKVIEYKDAGIDPYDFLDLP